MKVKVLVLLLLFTLLFQPVLGSTVTEVSDPGMANKILSNFETPIIRPGADGTFSFVLTNPYEEEMQNVRIAVELYAYATLDDETSIEDIDNPPVFVLSGATTTSFSLTDLTPGQEYPNQLRLETVRDTPKGVYFVRFRLVFDYNGEESMMKSKGYFTEAEWDYATRRPGTSDQPYYSGSINITHLEVNGIIPDSSFTVKTPIPRWPQYLLGGMAGFFGILAVMLYMQEEYNSFPWLEKTFNEWSGKLKQFRRRLEYRLRKR